MGCLAAQGADARLSEQELCPDELLAGQEAAFARDIEKLKLRRADFVTVCCPACRNSNSPPIFEKFSFIFRSCPACQTLFMSPRPSPEIMAAYYQDSENYRYWADHIFPASEAVRREKLHRPWLQRVLGYCIRFGVPRGTLLEVGPGFGTFAALAAASGQFERVVAVEPTPELAAACRARGVETIQCRVEEIGAALGRIDVAVAFEVIEHLFDPRSVLQGMAGRLTPGGLLVLSCPNGLGFDIALLGAASLAVDAEHINLFNPESLARLVTDCGFEVLDVTTPGRLDAELVREAAQAGRLDLSKNSFLQRVLLDEWDRLGTPFQRFLSENNLSSHMWLAARRLEIDP
jgi:2-polyprenyl-3-methyl-5-hydroxy-6-metoxy-1,4-benzoquinol methylase